MHVDCQWMTYLIIEKSGNQKIPVIGWMIGCEYKIKENDIWIHSVGFSAGLEFIPEKMLCHLVLY